jgi:hypothetical protein
MWGYKVWCRGHRQWHDPPPPAEFYKNLQNVSEVITAERRQNGDLMSLTFLLNENGFKIENLFFNPSVPF